MERKYSSALVIRKCNEFIWFRRVADAILRPESDAHFMPYNTGNFFPECAMLMNKNNLVREASSHLLID